VEQASNQVRIVATLPGAIDELLMKRGVANPKYAGHWQRVRVPPFREKEMNALLSLLPEKVRKVAAEHREAIMTRAAFGASTAEGLAPRKLQCLCSRLFHADREGGSAKDLSAIIDNRESYL
jgi:hypothetical protein